MKIQFVILDSNQIINLCGPERTPILWTLPSIEKCRIETEKYIKQINKINGFYEKLEKSILNEGFRNPILVSAGFFNDEYKKVDTKPTNTIALKIKVHPSKIKFIDKLIVCNTYGGSRLWVAQKHNLDIPCIVNNFTKMFCNEPELKTKEDILKFFKDSPNHLYFKETGVYFSNSPSYTDLEKNEY